MLKRQFWYALVSMVLIAVILSACGGGSSNSAEDSASGSVDNMAKTELMSSEMDEEENAIDVDEGEGATEEAKRGLSEEESTVSPEDDASESAASVAELTDRKVIYHAQIDMQVKNFNDTRHKIEAIAKKANGYIVETSQNEDEDQIDGYFTVRIPQDKFTGFLDQVEQLADKVPQREVTGSDVTEEYVDLESRLKAKKAVEERLLKFMEDAKKTEDLLKISDDLGQVQEEIEQLTGRMNYLQNQVAYSTVDISVTQQVVNRGVSGENERNTIAAAWSALIASTNGVLSFLSGLVVFLAGSLPVLIILIVIAIPLWVWWRKKGKHYVASKVKKRDSDE